MKPVLVNRINTKNIVGNEFKLKFFGDFHYGSKQCNEEKLKEEIERIKKDNCKVILMGDEINVGTKHSVGGGVWDDKIDIQTQFEEIADLLLPIKDKILGIHSSNHLQRIYNETSLDLTKQLAKILGISYFGFGVFHHLTLNGRTYILYSTHGSSGAVLPYTKIKAAVNLATHNQADLIAMGHLHSLESLTINYHAVNLKDKTLEERKRYFVLTGSYMNYKGSYAEMKNYGPSRIGCASAYFSKDKWNIRIETD